ncbi:MAG: efflux RND transporter periplasmic adaptor subunit [Rhodospirillaceae bacterium]
MSQERHSALGMHALDTGDAELLKRRQIVRRAKIAAVVVIVLLAAGAGRTVMSRISSARALEAGSVELAKQYVKITHPKIGQEGQTVALPGTLQGYVQSPIAARASGYLRKWYKDIGSRVQQGEVLAEIESPELDQQLTQAMAAREQAASSMALAKSTVERWEALRKKDAVSQQELDEKRSAYAQAQANVAAAEANVRRLQELTGFKRVVAPFSGIVTRRNVDVGDLIDAGGGAGRALFLLSQTDPLRVYVNVPQAYSQLVKAGQKVTVTQSELRGEKFRGEVARTSGSIDTQTRTMQVEVVLPNREGRLLPGAYVQVELPLEASKAMTISTNTLMFRSDGTRVAVVNDDGKVQLRAVKLGRNYGDTIEVLDGLQPADRIVMHPPDALSDGDVVAIAPAATASAKATQ